MSMAIDPKKREGLIVIFALVFLAVFIPYAIYKFVRGNAEYDSRYTLRKTTRLFRITSLAIDEFVKANGRVPIDAQGALSQELVSPIDYIAKAAKEWPEQNVTPRGLPPDPFASERRSAREKYIVQKKYSVVIDDELFESDTPIRIYKCDFVPRGYVLVTNGMDRKPDITGPILDPATLAQKTYDPTNGAVSGGDYIH